MARMPLPLRIRHFALLDLRYYSFELFLPTGFCAAEVVFQRFLQSI